MLIPDHPTTDPASVLTDELRRAFRSTQYRFEIPGRELLLAIDCDSEPLRRLLHETGNTCAAAITAYNPGSQRRDDDSNRRAQQQLEDELRTQQLTCFRGRHVNPRHRWPDEISVLVLGLPCPIACDMAARYGQLAILWSDAAGTPRLIEIAAQTPISGP